MFITLQQSDHYLNAHQNGVNMRPRFSKVFRHLSLFDLYISIYSEMCAKMLWITLKEKQYLIFFFFKLNSNVLKSKLIIQTSYFMANFYGVKCYFLCLEACLYFCHYPMNLPSNFDATDCPCSLFNKIYSWSRDTYKNLTCLSWESFPLFSISLFFPCLYPEGRTAFHCLPSALVAAFLEQTLSFSSMFICSFEQHTVI